jgi:hypothetical protein
MFGPKLKQEAVEFSRLNSHDSHTSYGSLAGEPSAESKEPVSSGFFASPSKSPQQKFDPKQPDIFDQSRLTAKQKKIALEAAELYKKCHFSNIGNGDSKDHEQALLMEAIRKGATLADFGGAGFTFDLIEIVDKSQLAHINLQFLRAHEQIWNLQETGSFIAKPLNTQELNFRRNKRDEILEKLVFHLLDCHHQGGDVKKWLEDRLKDPSLSHHYPKLKRSDIDKIFAKLIAQLHLEQQAQGIVFQVRK